MGCVASKNQVDPRGGSSEQGILPDRQVEILKDTWNMLAEDSEEVGMQLLHRFFDNSREIKFLFARFAKDDLKDSDSFVIDDDKLRPHAQNMMQAFEACIETIGEDPETTALLIDTLKSSGESHATVFGVRPYMFKPMWFALQSTLEDQLRDVYSNEIEEAWSALFTFLSDTMIEGMKPHLAVDDQTFTAT